MSEAFLYAFLPSLMSTIIVISLAGVVYSVYLIARQRRDELRKKEVELSLMRENLERKIYDISKRIESNSERWADINHLLVKNNFNYTKEDISTQKDYSNSIFLKRSGVNVNKIVEDRKSIFVLMPFHSDFDIYYDAIKKTCISIGLHCKRGDENFSTGNVLSSILNGIISSRMVVCLIDGRNPNVYYELGLTHALDKPAVLLSSGDLSSIPFDIKSNRIVMFRNIDELENGLQRSLLEHVIDA